MAKRLVFRIKSKEKLVQDLTKRLMAYHRTLQIEEAVSAVKKTRAVFAATQRNLEIERQATGRDPSDTVPILARQRMEQMKFRLLTVLLALNGSQLQVENLDPGFQLVKVFKKQGALSSHSFERAKNAKMTRIIREIHKGTILCWPAEKMAGWLTTLRVHYETTLLDHWEALFYHCDLVAMHDHYFRFSGGKYEVLC